MSKHSVGMPIAQNAGDRRCNRNGSITPLDCTRRASSQNLFVTFHRPLHSLLLVFSPSVLIKHLSWRRVFAYMNQVLSGSLKNRGDFVLRDSDAIRWTPLFSAAADSKNLSPSFFINVGGIERWTRFIESDLGSGFFERPAQFVFEHLPIAAKRRRRRHPADLLRCPSGRHAVRAKRARISHPERGDLGTVAACRFLDGGRVGNRLGKHRGNEL